MDEAAAAASDGPVVLYWYGPGGQPSRAIQGLGRDGIQRIRDAGGIVVAPSVVQFFFDHAYATVPSPYEGGLPAGFPSDCMI